MKKIIQALEKTGQLENTMIVLAGDQGYSIGYHGVFDKRYPYDENISGPLIVSWPKKFAQGERRNQPVNGADVIQTILGQTGLQPKDPTDGRDLTPLLQAGADNKMNWHPKPFVQCYTSDLYDVPTLQSHLKDENFKPLTYDMRLGGHAPVWIMYHDGRYKYVRYLAKDYIEELYDLEQDPLESDNLAMNPEKSAELERMSLEGEKAFKAYGWDFVPMIPAPVY